MHGFVQSLIWPARAYLCVVNGGTRQGLGVHQILFITAADLCVLRPSPAVMCHRWLAGGGRRRHRAPLSGSLRARHFVTLALEGDNGSLRCHCAAVAGTQRGRRIVQLRLCRD